jgi:hypothetical protein
VTFVIDKSGGMDTNDHDGYRLKAVQQFVDSLEIGDQTALIGLRLIGRHASPSDSDSPSHVERLTG